MSEGSVAVRPETAELAIERLLREVGSGDPPDIDDPDSGEQREFYLKLVSVTKGSEGGDRTVTSVKRHRKVQARNVSEAFLIGLRSGMFDRGGHAQAGSDEFLSHYGQDLIKMQLLPRGDGDG